MWPFKKKTDHEDLKQKAYKEVVNFRKIGEKFYYLGIEMLVTGHQDVFFNGYGLAFIPCIKADYINRHGEIKQIQFAYKELNSLIAENI